MDTEIELKYLVSGENISEKVTSLLSQQGFSHKKEIKHLRNSYFDTEQLALRKADCGFRIRSYDSVRLEQTIKTAGKVIGGLHQRPEYNIPVTSEIPDLTLFDSDIWPENFNAEEVNEQLVVLFSTDFTRQSWLITMPDASIVELAYDVGVIAGNEQEDPISELEIELVSGNRQSLFDLALLLFKILPLRPGTESKAARGYALAFGKKKEKINTVDTLLNITPKMNVLESFNIGFTQCLHQLQVLVEQFEKSNDLLVLREVSDCLALARHGLWLYADYLTGEHGKELRTKINAMLHELSWVETAKQIKELTTKKGHYRKKIEYSKSLLNQLKDENHAIIDFDKASRLFHSDAFNDMQLSMLQMILIETPYTDNIPELSDFAPSWLSIHLKNLVTALSSQQSLTTADYLENHRLLTRSLLTGAWFGLLFNSEKRNEFRGPWLDLHQGIDELATLQLLKDHLQDATEEPPIKLINWLDNKLDNLVCALGHSKDAALSLSPYWLKA